MAYGYDPLSAFQAGIDAENKGYWTPIAGAQKAAMRDFAFLEDARNAPLRALQTDYNYAKGDAALEDFGNQRMAGDQYKALNLETDENGDLLDNYAKANRLREMALQSPAGIGSIFSDQSRKLYLGEAANAAQNGDLSRSISSLKGAGVLPSNVGFRLNADSGTATFITGEGDLRREETLPIIQAQQRMLDLSNGKGILQQQGMKAYADDLLTQNNIAQERAKQQDEYRRQYELGRQRGDYAVQNSTIRQGGGVGAGGNTLNLSGIPGAVMAGAAGSGTQQAVMPSAQIAQPQSTGQYIVPAIQPSGGRTAVVQQQAMQQQVPAQSQPVENPNDPLVIFRNMSNDVSQKEAAVRSAQDVLSQAVGQYGGLYGTRATADQLNGIRTQLAARQQALEAAVRNRDIWARQNQGAFNQNPYSQSVAPFVIPKY